jgi:hypothetical protein
MEGNLKDVVVNGARSLILKSTFKDQMLESGLNSYESERG